MSPNDYDKIAAKYASSDAKPDKAFSILPTVLAMAGNVKNKVVIDLGCGSGFFTRALAKKGAKKVYGLDNSKRQIMLARKQPSSRKIEYRLSDMFREPIPTGHVFNAPFVLNYAPDKNALATFICKLHSALKPGGKLILVFDDPKNLDLKRFGAVKKIKRRVDGADFTIDLFNQGKHLCALRAKFYKPETVKRLLRESGFRRVKTQRPIISAEGEGLFGKKFWKGYRQNSELCYIKAYK